MLWNQNNFFYIWSLPIFYFFDILLYRYGVLIHSIHYRHLNPLVHNDVYFCDTNCPCLHFFTLSRRVQLKIRLDLSPCSYFVFDGTTLVSCILPSRKCQYSHTPSNSYISDCISSQQRQYTCHVLYLVLQMHLSYWLCIIRHCTL